MAYAHIILNAPTQSKCSKLCRPNMLEPKHKNPITSILLRSTIPSVCQSRNSPSLIHILCDSRHHRVSTSCFSDLIRGYRRVPKVSTKQHQLSWLYVFGSCLREGKLRQSICILNTFCDLMNNCTSVTS